MTDKTLSVVEQKTVEFYDDELIAVRAADGHVYVSIRHMCEALGINTQGQTRRIQRQPVLVAGRSWVDILSTQPHPQRRRAQVLRVDLVPLWLTGISTKSIKDEETREKLLKFQQEAAKVLYEAFQEGRLTATPTFDDLLEKDSPAVAAYKTALAIVELARNQVLLEARLDDFGERLERVEATLGDPGRNITPDQASQISQAVKAVAMIMTKKSGSSQYGAVYGELYRKFGITSYKLLPANRFEEATKFLSDWHQSLAGEEPF